MSTPAPGSNGMSGAKLGFPFPVPDSLHHRDHAFYQSFNAMKTCSAHPLDPTPESLARRAELGRLFSGLRRVRSRTPFFLLPAHRIPTLWGLYRSLQREAPSSEIRWRVRKVFERYRHLTGTTKTIQLLRQGYKYLDVFQKARAGDVHLQYVLERYSRLIATKRWKEKWKQVMREEIAWQYRLAAKPMLTGSMMRPTLDNAPMPRMYPQPDHMSHIIYKRKVARERRFKRQLYLQELKQDVLREAEFEEGVAATAGTKVEMTFGGDTKEEWTSGIEERLGVIYKAHERSKARLTTTVTSQLFETLVAARRYKIENKTREKENARRGVWSKKVFERARQRPPAHIMDRMGPKQKEIDRLKRLPGEAGYVGMVKRMAGMRLKDTQTWKLEDKASPDALRREREFYEEQKKRSQP